MTCLKCGNQCDESFCAECLEKMDQKPVRNTAVTVNRRDRDAYYARKQYSQQNTVLADALLRKAKKRILRQKIMIWMLVMVIIAMGVAGWLMYRRGHIVRTGQNYSVTVPKENPDDVSRETSAVR